MPSWALALSMAVALLQALEPELLAIIAALEGKGESAADARNALGALHDAVGSINGAMLNVAPKP